MKLFLTILFAVCSFGAFSQTPEQKLMVTVKQFHQALVDGNTVSVNQQTDKALSYGHSNGLVETKSELINHILTGYFDYNKYSEDSMVVSLNDKMASVRFRADINVSWNNTPGNYQLYVLEVWVKKANRWILFARQATPVKN